MIFLCDFPSVCKGQDSDISGRIEKKLSDLDMRGLCKSIVDGIAQAIPPKEDRSMVATLVGTHAS